MAALLTRGTRPTVGKGKGPASDEQLELDHEQEMRRVSDHARENDAARIRLQEIARERREKEAGRVRLQEIARERREKEADRVRDPERGGSGKAPVSKKALGAHQRDRGGPSTRPKSLSDAVALDRTKNRLAGIVARKVPGRRAEHQAPDESETTEYLVNTVKLLVTQARRLKAKLERRTQKVEDLREELLDQNKSPLMGSFWDQMENPPALPAPAPALPAPAPAPPAAADTGDLGRLVFPSINVNETDSDGNLGTASYEVGATVMGGYALERGGNAVWVGAITGQVGLQYSVGWFGVLGRDGVVTDEPSSEQINFHGRLNRSFEYMTSDPDLLDDGSWCIVKE